MKKTIYLAFFAFILFYKNLVFADQLLNKKIVNFVKAHINQKVGKGECIDLCLEALKYSGANVNKANEEILGEIVDYRKTEILAGDFIHFKNAFFTEDNLKQRWVFEKHFAIINKVISNKTVQIAHQNLLNNKTVFLNIVDLAKLNSGEIIIYRAKK